MTIITNLFFALSIYFMTDDKKELLTAFYCMLWFVMKISKGWEGVGVGGRTGWGLMVSLHIWNGTLTTCYALFTTYPPYLSLPFGFQTFLVSLKLANSLMESLSISQMIARHLISPSPQTPLNGLSIPVNSFLSILGFILSNLAFVPLTQWKLLLTDWVLTQPFHSPLPLNSPWSPLCFFILLIFRVCHCWSGNVEPGCSLSLSVLGNFHHTPVWGTPWHYFWDALQFHQDIKTGPSHNLRLWLHVMMPFGTSNISQPKWDIHSAAGWNSSLQVHLINKIFGFESINLPTLVNVDLWLSLELLFVWESIFHGQTGSSILLLPAQFPVVWWCMLCSFPNYFLLCP